MKKPENVMSDQKSVCPDLDTYPLPDDQPAIIVRTADIDLPPRILDALSELYWLEREGK
jgi:hypothetical protein